MNKLRNLWLMCVLALPDWALAEINTVYDAKLKASEVKDAVANSSIYSIVLYSGGAIIILAMAIIIIMFLVMLLKR